MFDSQAHKLKFDDIKKDFTIDRDDNIWDKEHEDNKQKPDNHLHRPSTMMPRVTPIVLVFHTNHDQSVNSKEEKVPKAHTKNSLLLIPFFSI